MLYNIIRPSKIPYSAGKCAIFPNPNRITRQKSEAFDQSMASDLLCCGSLALAVAI